MARARVRLNDTQRRAKTLAATTNADGFYQIDRVPVSVYQITAETAWGAATPIEVPIFADQPAAGDLTVVTPIDQKAQQLGSNFTGAPTMAESEVGDGAGRYRDFELASIYWKPRLGAFEVNGDIRAAWLKLGGVLNSKLGYPITDEADMPDKRGRFNDFEEGGVYWTPDTGAHEVRGPIRDTWLNKYFDALGYPRTDLLATADGTQFYNIFEKGCIAWYPSTGAVNVYFGTYSTDSTSCEPIIY